jgi:hypothetical protein
MRLRNVPDQGAMPNRRSECTGVAVKRKHVATEYANLLSDRPSVRRVPTNSVDSARQHDYMRCNFAASLVSLASQLPYGAPTRACSASDEALAETRRWRVQLQGHRRRELGKVRLSRWNVGNALCKPLIEVSRGSSGAEHVLGKDGVGGSIPLHGTMISKRWPRACGLRQPNGNQQEGLTAAKTVDIC